MQLEDFSERKTLFGEVSCPVTPKWSDPGDAPRMQRHRRQHASSHPTGQKARSATASNASLKRQEKKNDFRLSNFRQPIADQDELDFRHMHWGRLRVDVRHAMHAAGTSTTALERFDNCGAECVIEWSDEAQRYRLRASYCHCRHCKPCSKARGHIVSRNLQNKLTEDPTRSLTRFRFITLTLRHTRRPLIEQLRDLLNHFRKLRNSKLWKNTQRGGYFSIEVKLNEAGEWHPHLHIIAEGEYLQQHALANHWMAITKGSFKVDIRKIGSVKDVAMYVAKYVSKGADDSVWQDADKAMEWVCASRGMRTCATFGSWRGFRLLKPDTATMVTDWKPIALLSRIADEARRGVISAVDMLMHLADTIQFNPSRPRKCKADKLQDT